MAALKKLILQLAALTLFSFFFSPPQNEQNKVKMHFMKIRLCGIYFPFFLSMQLRNCSAIATSLHKHEVIICSRTVRLCSLVQLVPFKKYSGSFLFSVTAVEHILYKPCFQQRCVPCERCGSRFLSVKDISARGAQPALPEPHKLNHHIDVATY